MMKSRLQDGRRWRRPNGFTGFIRGASAPTPPLPHSSSSFHLSKRTKGGVYHGLALFVFGQIEEADGVELDGVAEVKQVSGAGVRIEGNLIRQADGQGIVITEDAQDGIVKENTITTLTGEPTGRGLRLAGMTGPMDRFP